MSSNGHLLMSLHNVYSLWYVFRSQMEKSSSEKLITSSNLMGLNENALAIYLEMDLNP